MNNKWYINESTLAHHGIKGQKWGIRRYQNDDGTLTTEGKKRYGDATSYNTMSRENKKLYRQDLREDVKNYKTDRKQLSKEYKKNKNNYTALENKAMFEAGRKALDEKYSYITQSKYKDQLVRKNVAKGVGIPLSIIAGFTALKYASLFL